MAKASLRLETMEIPARSDRVIAHARTSSGSVRATIMSPAPEPRAAAMTDAHVRPQRPPPTTTMGTGKVADRQKPAKSGAIAVSSVTVVSRRRLHAAEIILSSERKIPQYRVDPSEELADRRDGNDGSGVNIVEPGVRKHFSQFCGSQQHCVFVDVAGFYDVLGRGIIWVVLEYKRQAARPCYTKHLRSEARPLRRRHMMHHADGEHDRELSIAIRQPAAIEGRIVHKGMFCGREFDASRRDIDAMQLPKLALESGVIGTETAAKVEHVQTPEVPKMLPDQPKNVFALDVDVERVFAPGEGERRID